MRNLVKKIGTALSILFLSACSGTTVNDKGYQIWYESLSEGTTIQYCYYVKVFGEEDTITYYNAFGTTLVSYGLQIAATPFDVYFKYVDGEDTISGVDSSVYQRRVKQVKDGTLEGVTGAFVTEPIQKRA